MKNENTYFDVCDTYGSLFAKNPIIQAKTAKIAVQKYLASKNILGTPKFNKRGNGSIVVRKLRYCSERDKFYRDGRTTTYDRY